MVDLKNQIKKIQDQQLFANLEVYVENNLHRIVHINEISGLISCLNVEKVLTYNYSLIFHLFFFFTIL